jgi:tetratricopeptide (TPR) repeat protein
MKVLPYIVVNVIAGCLFFWLTNPAEMRPHRWVRIGLSVVPVSFLAGIFFGEGLPCSPIGGIALMLWIVANGGVLCLLWLNPLSHLAAGGVVNLLDPDPGPSRYTRPDYGLAQSHRREGEIKEAIAATRRELEKEPANFEGLILLAQLYQDVNLPKDALRQLEVILNDPQATDEQKEAARAERAACTSLARHLEAMELYREHSGQ